MVVVCLVDLCGAWRGGSLVNVFLLFCDVMHSLCRTWCLHCCSHSLPSVGSDSKFPFRLKQVGWCASEVFSTTLLPSLSVHGSCGWAAVDGALWEQFAGHLGDDASLQNIGLLASMQPADIQEAIMATTTGAVDDVGAPLPAVPEQKPVVPRGEGGSSLKIKVASVFDQASDREVERVSPEVLRKLRARFRAVEGEDPMKTEEVTDDQLSAVYSLTQAGINPYADFGVWRPFGQRAAKSLKLVSHFLDNTGSWRCKEIPGPDSIGGSSAPRRSCAIWPRQQCWIGMRRHFVHAWNVSRRVGTCACWQTPGVERSTGKPSNEGRFYFTIENPELSRTSVEQYYPRIFLGDF